MVTDADDEAEGEKIEVAVVIEVTPSCCAVAQGGERGLDFYESAGVISEEQIRAVAGIGPAAEQEIGPAVVVVIAPGAEAIVEAHEAPTAVGQDVCAGVVIEFCAKGITPAEEDIKPAIVVVIGDADRAAGEIGDEGE